jgi:hypothetical protein
MIVDVKYDYDRACYEATDEHGVKIVTRLTKERIIDEPLSFYDWVACLRDIAESVTVIAPEWHKIRITTKGVEP